jgi:hypothetical protein
MQNCNYMSFYVIHWYKIDMLKGIFTYSHAGRVLLDFPQTLILNEYRFSQEPLIKYQGIRTYVGSEVQLHIFLPDNV